jgi:hypothetical protein
VSREDKMSSASGTSGSEKTIKVIVFNGKEAKWREWVPAVEVTSVLYQRVPEDIFWTVRA